LLSPPTSPALFPRPCFKQVVICYLFPCQVHDLSALTTFDSASALIRLFLTVEGFRALFTSHLVPSPSKTGIQPFFSSRGVSQQTFFHFLSSRFSSPLPLPLPSPPKVLMDRSVACEAALCSGCSQFFFMGLIGIHQSRYLAPLPPRWWTFHPKLIGGSLLSLSQSNFLISPFAGLCARPQHYFPSFPTSQTAFFRLQTCGGSLVLQGMFSKEPFPWSFCIQNFASPR